MNHNRKRLNFICSLFFLLSTACNQETNNDEEEHFIPQASGKIETIVIVADSTIQNGLLSREIDSILNFSYPGLVFEEPVLNLQYVQPDNFGTVWERFRHIFIPITLSGDTKQNSRIKSYFTDQLLANKGKDFFSFIQKDVFAEGQDVFVVVGKDLKILQDSLFTIKENVRYFYDQNILEALKNNLKRNSQDSLAKKLLQTHGITFTIPQHFQVAIKDSNFFWIRKAHDDYDLNTFLTFKEYVSESQFEDENIIEWRNSIGKRKLLGTESHMETQLDPLPRFEEKNINGLYTKVGRGLWHMSDDNFMGGYFVSYTFVNEQTNRIYYLESFLYYPRKNASKNYWKEKMRKYREGEAIINSFELK